VIEASQLGLEPDNTLGYAYLIPYGKTAQLQIGWRGFIKLAHNSGIVSNVYAMVVHSNDRYEIKQGLHRDLIHEPTSSADEGEVVAAYAVVKYKDGTEDFEWMWKKDIDKIRSMSKAKNSDAWSNHYEEMAKKTVIRRLAKRLPLSAEFQRAAVHDENLDMGIVGDVDTTTGEVIDITDQLKGKLDEQDLRETQGEDTIPPGHEPPPPEEVEAKEIALVIDGESVTFPSHEDAIKRVKSWKGPYVERFFEENDVNTLPDDIKAVAQAKYIKLVGPDLPGQEPPPPPPPPEEKTPLPPIEDEKFYTDLKMFREVMEEKDYNDLVEAMRKVYYGNRELEDLSEEERGTFISRMQAQLDKKNS
jgi:recombinational DNA repair protein RecT